MKQAWLLRPYPNNVKRLDEFRRDEVTAIGWAELGDLSGLTREEIKAKLQAGPFLLAGTRLGNSYATVDIFVNRMQKDDLLLVPDGDDIFFARVESGYFFEPGRQDDGYPHQRRVTWLRNTGLTLEWRGAAMKFWDCGKRMYTCMFAVMTSTMHWYPSGKNCVKIPG